MTDIAINVQNLSKCYQIYENPRDRLKQFLLPRIQRTLRIKSKQYFREFWALRDVTFQVRKGETIGIVGLNGSGKSTLLKMICGTLSATSGSVTTQGRVAALLELGSGFNPEFTGKENVYMNASILGLSEDEITAKYDAIVEFADICDFINQSVKTYSSGMYVRLAFAVIANVDADILIIDEALAVGDAVFSQKCMRFLREFKKNGTVFFVSHNPGAVVNLCDRAIWLDKGVVQEIGTAKTVCAKYLARRYQSNHNAVKDNLRNSENKVVERSAELIQQTDDSKRDMRIAYINNSNMRNDIRIFDFATVINSSGNGGASLTYAGVEDLHGHKLSWVVGGEIVRIIVNAIVFVEGKNLIIGFNLKDKLGQVLIGQNTYLDGFSPSVTAKKGDLVEAIFTFQMPILPKGTYVIDVAIADGSPPDTIQLLWVHDAFIMESITSSVVGGLIGLPFDGIELRNTTTGNSNEQ